MFLYVMMNITSPVKSQNQLYILKKTLIIISLGGFYLRSNVRTRKNIKVLFIAIMRPCLNKQIIYNALILFRNGVT